MFLTGDASVAQYQESVLVVKSCSVNSLRPPLEPLSRNKFLKFFLHRPNKALGTLILPDR